ncbi:MAG: peptidoglycan DD-metalloendopeptidase family protein [Chitinophagaceae bacterium]|nr:peptidoglycan DD-metalloendopeptidase family protein [Chitinophagaceae bacterium]
MASYQPRLLIEALLKHQKTFNKVVPYRTACDLCPLDLSENNTELTEEVFSSPQKFSEYIFKKIRAAGAVFGFGGYGELRKVYCFSPVFDGKGQDDEPRRFHLGIDIWGKAGTEVMAPLDGIVHSFADNHRMGDYGPTIILQHQMDEFVFYTLYGHLSRSSLFALKKGNVIRGGQVFARLGAIEENVGWPPHLHFQIICNTGNYKGDYPGVCKFSEREQWMMNSPDADLILGFNRFFQAMG